MFSSNTKADGPLCCFGMTISQAIALVSRSREAGKRIVFTNGVFDLLHPGHLRYLQRSRELGDMLIVGVNSDQSVNKGSGRRVTPERERVELLEALPAPAPASPDG